MSKVSNNKINIFTSILKCGLKNEDRMGVVADP